MSKFVIVDVESDGQVPGINSMVCFGAVILDRDLNKTFYGQTAPISKIYEPDALAISGFTRKEHEKFEHPEKTMLEFKQWLKDNTSGSPVLFSDNNQFDGMYMNYYMHVYTGKNPFGWTSRRIGDLFCGFYNDPYYKWTKHRVSKHTHHPVDDAKGNAEALLYLIDQGFKLKV
jgi:DNA polymerase III alpha subunit (gram-positive type)